MGHKTEQGIILRLDETLEAPLAQAFVLARGFATSVRCRPQLEFPAAWQIQLGFSVTVDRIGLIRPMLRHALPRARLYVLNRFFFLHHNCRRLIDARLSPLWTEQFTKIC